MTHGFDFEDFSKVENALYGNVEDDEELLAELLALEDEEKPKKRVQVQAGSATRTQNNKGAGLPQRTAPALDLTEIQRIAQLNEDFEPGDNCRSASVDDNDPHLLAEFDFILGDESEESHVIPDPPTFRPSIKSESKHDESPAAAAFVSIDFLNERLSLYTQAQQNAKEANDSAKARRLARGVTTLQTQIKLLQTGKQISENDVPPPVSVKASPREPPPPLPPKVASTAPVVNHDDVSKNEGPVDSSHYAISKSTDKPVAKVADPLPDKPLLDKVHRPDQPPDPPPRREKTGLNSDQPAHLQIPAPSMPTVKSEPKITALKPNAESHKRLSDVTQEGGQASRVPGGLDTDNAEAESRPIEDLLKLPPAPKSALEALQQRLEKYESALRAAQEENNGSKARRMGRIVKQYTAAITAYKAGKPVDFDALPAPPGFPPIPQDSKTSSSSSAGHPTAKLPIDKDSAQAQIKATDVSPKPVSQPRPSPAASGLSPPKVSRQAQQLDFILQRQKQFKLAAVHAKKQGNLELAKRYLLQAKGFEQMIEASNNGMPVDISKIPTPPQLKGHAKTTRVSHRLRLLCATHKCAFLIPGESFGQAKLVPSVEGFTTARLPPGSREMPAGFVTSSESSEEIYSTLEKDLIRQLQVSAQNSEYFTKLGNVAQAAFFDKEYGSLKGYEPKDLNVFVKFGFPFPAESPQEDKTPCVKGTNCPTFKSAAKFSMDRKSRAFQRAIKHKAIKFEVFQKGGFLRSDKLLGSAELKCASLEDHATVHEGLDLLMGRKPCGGKLEVKLRIREPLQQTGKSNLTKEKWLVIDEFMALRDAGNNAWELSKENVEPLKHGRHIEALNESLAQAKKKNSALVQEKEAWQKRLEAATGSASGGRLEDWIHYLKWVEQHFPQGAGREFRTALEACMKLFMGDIQYRNDKHWWYCWRKMAQCSQKVGKFTIYNHMKQEGHCDKLTDFYKQWAFDKEADLEVLDSKDFKAVLDIFESGLRAGAEPRQELLLAKEQFEDRLARRLGSCSAVSDDVGAPDEETRNFLGLLKPVKGTGALRGAVQAPAIRRSQLTTPGLTLQHGSQNTSTMPGSLTRNFQIYSEPGPNVGSTSSAGAPMPRSDNPLDIANLCLSSQRENVRDPSKWPGQKLTGSEAKAPSTQYHFNIFTDSNSDAAKSMPPPRPPVQQQMNSRGRTEVLMFCKDELIRADGSDIMSIEERLAQRWFRKHNINPADVDRIADQAIDAARQKQQREQVGKQMSKRKGLSIRDKVEAHAPDQGPSCSRDYTNGSAASLSSAARPSYAGSADATLDSTMTTNLKHRVMKDMFQTLTFSSLEEPENGNEADEELEPEPVPKSAPAFQIFMDGGGQMPVTSSGSVHSDEDKENVPPPQYHQYKEVPPGGASGVLTQRSGYAEAYDEEMRTMNSAQQNSASRRALQFDPSRSESSSSGRGGLASQNSDFDNGDLEYFDPNESTVAKFGKFVSGQRRTNSTPIHGGFVQPPPTCFSVLKPGDVHMPSPDKVEPIGFEHDEYHEPILEPVRPIPMPMDHEQPCSSHSSRDEGRSYLHPSTPGLAYGNLPTQILSAIPETSREYRSSSCSSGSSGARTTTTVNSAISSVHKLDTVMEFHPLTPGAMSGEVPSRCVYTDPKTDVFKPNAVTPGATRQSHVIPAASAGAVRKLSLDEQDQDTQQDEREPLRPHSKAACLDGPEVVDENVEKTGFGMTTKILKGINPFSPEIQMRIITQRRVQNKLNQLPNYHVFTNASMPNIRVGGTISPGGSKHLIKERIGQGAFAVAYHTIEDGESLCIKVQKPAAYWEFYICEEVRQRLKQLAYTDQTAYAISNPCSGSLMFIHDAYIYSNGSIFINDYHEHGTLLDLVNKYKARGAIGVGKQVNELVVIHFLLEMLTLVEFLHKVSIIHADIKPDNFLIKCPPPLINSPDDLVDDDGSYVASCLKLIDFGRAIDMAFLGAGVTFLGTADTSGFQCPEMLEERPWNYQTDYFCILASIYVLITGNYMLVRKQGDMNVTSCSFNRRWNVGLWKEFFGALLNIPSCSELPDLSEYRRKFSEYLQEALRDNVNQWNAEVTRMRTVLEEEKRHR